MDFEPALHAQQGGNTGYRGNDIGHNNCETHLKNPRQVHFALQNRITVIDQDKERAHDQRGP